ncbi:hypothetical protein LTS08_002995 [Lithohypha guttulata]|nr:hypothetical protein LTS08_002995 [Lithohypha guttulata]
MHFTNILSFTLPFLALASAVPTEGQKPGAGKGSGSLGEHGFAKGGPPEGFEGVEGNGKDGPPFGDDSTPFDARQQHKRALDVNADLKECKSDGKTCVTYTAVPAGKLQGECINRHQPEEYAGYIHVQHGQLMCEYYSDPDCSGCKAGPWSRRERQYNFNVYRQDKAWPVQVYNPQSVKCRIITFDVGPVDNDYYDRKQSQSLRIAPPAAHPSTTTNTQSSKLSSTSSSVSRGAPSAPGLPDTLRLSQQTHSSSASQISSTHPLEARLSQWQQTQANLQSTLLRRTFGIALPLRMAMEQKIVDTSDNFRPSVLGPVNSVHGDILRGRDASIEWEDVYNGQDGLRGTVDRGGDGQGVGWTEEMEMKVGMGRW